MDWCHYLTKETGLDIAEKLILSDFQPYAARFSMSNSHNDPLNF